MASAAAWLLGLLAFASVSTPLWQPGQSMVIVTAVGILGGLVMAAVVAAVTGAALLRLVPQLPAAEDDGPAWTAGQGHAPRTAAGAVTSVVQPPRAVVVCTDGSAGGHQGVRWAVAAGVHVEKMIVRDRPTAFLIMLSHRAQLLVLGRSRRGGVLGMIAGSPAEALLRATHCPVLVVPAGPPRRTWLPTAGYG